jgi:hypothetical protein
MSMADKAFLTGWQDVQDLFPILFLLLILSIKGFGQDL